MHASMKCFSNMSILPIPVFGSAVGATYNLLSCLQTLSHGCSCPWGLGMESLES